MINQAASGLFGQPERRLGGTVNNMVTSMARFGVAFAQRNKDGVDQQRFVTLAQESLPDLYRYAFWLSRDPALAEDLVQACLLRAWRSFGSLRAHNAAKSWLFTILHREHARQFERMEPQCVTNDDLHARYDCYLDTSNDSCTTELRRAIFELETQYREPLVLQALMGCTAREIAAVMGISTSAVLTRLSQARKRLHRVVNGKATHVATQVRPH